MFCSEIRDQVYNTIYRSCFVSVYYIVTSLIKLPSIITNFLRISGLVEDCEIDSGVIVIVLSNMYILSGKNSNNPFKKLLIYSGF